MKTTQTMIGIGLCFLVLISSAARAQDWSNVSLIQQEVVASLSGVKAIDGTVLNQRSKPEERRLAAEYLSSQLVEHCWALENHNYKVSNGNIFLDLFFPPMEGINVSAKLAATKPSEEYILFGSHYDSERGSPGAIDNATGVALSMGVAYQLAQLTDRSVNYIVVFFDQEEDNEIGSKAYARMLRKSGKKVLLVNTFDMMGWDSDGNRGIEIELPSEGIEKLYYNEAKKLNIPIQTTKVSSSDHMSFIQEGFNALGTTEEYVQRDTTPHIHKPSDTYDTIDFEFLISSTRLVFNVFNRLH